MLSPRTRKAIRADLRRRITRPPTRGYPDRPHERVRLGALQTAMDRGFGKPVQHIEAEVSVYDSLSLAEQQALLAALDALDAADEPEPTSH